MHNLTLTFLNSCAAPLSPGSTSKVETFAFGAQQFATGGKTVNSFKLTPQNLLLSQGLIFDVLFIR